MADLAVCVAPCGISGLSQNSQDKTEQLMKSGLPQLRQKMQLYGMSAGLQCLEPDLSLFKILEDLCILHGTLNLIFLTVTYWDVFFAASLDDSS